MARISKGLVGWLVVLTLLLVLGSHVACSSEDHAGGQNDVDAAVSTTTEALTLPAINAAADTSVRQAFQYANDGTGTNLSVSSVAGAEQRSLIRFNQSAIAAAVGTQSLYRAQVELTIKTISDGWGGGELAVHAMTRTWPEGNGTFSPPGSHGPSWRCADDTDTSTLGNLVNNCTPANLWGMNTSDPDPIPFSATPSDTARLYSNGTTVLRFDVTADIRRFLSGDPNHGFIIRDTAGALHGAWVNFGSRETTTPPKLILDVGPDQCPADPNKVQPGRCGCGTPETDTDGDGQPDCAEPALIPVADTTLRLAVPNGNDGLGVNLGVTSASVVSLERTLIRFDQNELERLAAGCTVTSAQLELKVSGIAVGWNGGAIELRRMNRHWPEGVGLDVALGAHGPSWRCADDRNTSVPGNATNDCATSDVWGMRTTDPGPTPFESTVSDTEPIFTATTTQVVFDVTADVQSLFAGTPNYGWIIKGTDSPLSGAWVNFGSRETETPPVLRLTLDTSGNCGDRDGDGLSNGDETNDADPWTDPDIFNGMRARSANHCHATPTCAAIDTVAEVDACTAPAPRETKNQAGGWSWQNPSSADICSPGYGFRPEWSVCGADWQVDFQGFIKLDNDGQHCFLVSGDTNAACGSALFNNATTGFTSSSGVQCFNVTAGVYPIRWFYETSGGPKTDFKVAYCYGGSQACDPTEAVPTRSLRPQHSASDPVCDPQAPNCTDLCPCNPGKPCSSDANCGPAQACGVNNGGHFGLARDARACWSPQCEVSPQAVGCDFANARCGTCEDVKPCTTSAECPAGNVCGTDNGGRFNSAHQSVCWPAGCNTDPVQTGCGTPESPCGICSCSPNCANKQCGDDPSDGCGGTCTGFCQDREPGCTADWQCGPDSVCVLSGGPRVGAPPNTNVCLPIACNDFDVTRIPDCGTVNSVCGICPPCFSTCVEDGRECGTDARCGVSCGSCAQGSFCNGDGKCVASTTESLDFVNAANVTGATPGSFWVSDRGTAAYSVPFQMPPGINGFTPDLRLQYTSGKSNGLLGVGWSLEGLSAISRCPKTEGQDGYGRGAGWSGPGGDAFCLDGQRLRAVTGTYGHDGTEYRTEVDTLTKVVSFGQTGPQGNPRAFVAYTKAGNTLVYGVSEDSSMYFGSGTQARKSKWAVKLIADRSYNAIVVNYGRYFGFAALQPGNTEEIWPKSISYGGQVSPFTGIPTDGAWGGVPTDREVRFVYSEHRPDPLVGYASPGLRVSRSRLLERVETYVEKTLARSYSLTYDEAPVPQVLPLQGESRLVAITECAQDKVSLINLQMQCLPPTIFEYAYEEGFPSPPVVLNVGAGLPTTNPNAPVVIARNLDGDGMQDLLFRLGSDDAMATARATGNRAAPLTGPFAMARRLNDLAARAVLDFDGDGDDDLLSPAATFPDGSTAVFNLLSSRSEPSFATFDASSIEIPLRLSGFDLPTTYHALVDVDGDGLTDFLFCEGGNETFYVPQSSTQQIIVNLPEHGPCAQLARHPQTLDVDGDGVPNLIAIEGSHDWAYLRHDTLQWEPFELGVNSGNLKMGDLNGDGLQDVIAGGGHGFTVSYLNTGGGKFLRVASEVRLSSTAFDSSVLVDYDGDGDDDLIGPSHPGGPAQWFLFRSPEGFRLNHAETLGISIPPPVIVGTVAPKATLADLDGDSNQDLIIVDNEARLHVLYGAGARANLLTRVTDGLGKRIEVSYDAARGSVRTYTAGAECAWPARCVRDPGPLVREHRVLQVTPGGPIKSEGRTEYTYSDARRDVRGRGWLGFGHRQISEYHGADALVRFTDLTYDNHTQVNSSYYPFAGLVTGSVVVNATTSSPGLSEPSVRLTSTAYDWEFRALRGGPVDQEGFAFLNARTTTVAEIKAGATTFLPLTSTVENFEVDNFGNVTDHDLRAYVLRYGVDVTNPSHAATRTVVHRDYDLTAERVQSWLIGLPETETVEDTVGERKVRSAAYDFDSRGLLTAVTRAQGGPTNLSRRISLGRDGFGNVEFVRLAAADEPGQVQLLSAVYDPRGRYPIAFTNALGQPTERRYDARHGALSRSIDPNGRVHTWDYDGFGRLQQHTSPSSETNVSYQAASFDSSGMLPVHAVQRIVTSEDGQGTTEVDVDAFGRVVRSIVPGYQGARVVQEHEYGYLDDAGAIARHARPHLAGNTTQGIVENEFDVMGRIVREAYPDNTSAAYLYATHANVVGGKSSWFASSNAVQAQMRVDARGHADSRVFDVRGNPIANIDGLDHTTHYEYVGFNALRRIIDSQTNITTATVDDYGRQLSLTDPDMGTHTFTWNARDELKEYTDGNTVPGGVKTTFGYDNLGRLRTRTDEDGTTQWIYDGTGPNEIGELVETISPSGQRVRYGYEPVIPSRNRGLLNSITRTIVDSAGIETTLATSFQYDTFSRLREVNYPSAAGEAFRVRYVYDDGGNAIDVINTSTNQSLWSFVDADQGYRIRSERYGNGLRRDLSFEPLTGLLSTLNTTASNGVVVEDVRYLYDPNGNLRQRNNPRHDRLEDFTYDPLDRLETVTTRTLSTGAVASSTYGYDAIGNITSHPTLGSYSYQHPDAVSRPHAVATAGPNSYLYDGNGNQYRREGPGIPGGAVDIQYTAFDMPKRLATPTQTHEIKYDADQLRVLKTGPQATTIYAGDLYERRTSGTPGSAAHKYLIHVGGRQVAQVDRSENGGAITATAQSFLHDDLLGSPHVITDAAGIVIHQQQFEPFGNSDSPTGFITGNVSTGFTGHEHDPELGLINMQGRLYDPGIGRFITADPFIQSLYWSQGLNRYSYVANNPLNFTDPTGFYFPNKPPVPTGTSGGESGNGPKCNPVDPECIGAGGGGTLPEGNTGNPIVDLTKMGVQTGPSSVGQGPAPGAPPGLVPPGAGGGGMGMGVPPGSLPGVPQGFGPQGGPSARPPSSLPPGGGNFDNGGGFYNDWLPGQQSPDPRMMRSNQIGGGPAAAGVVACLANPLCAISAAILATASYIVVHNVAKESVEVRHEDRRLVHAERLHASSTSEDEEAEAAVKGGHTAGARESTREDHEAAERRRKMDQGGEKGDRRRAPPRQRPPGHKGPWPPK